MNSLRSVSSAIHFFVMLHTVFTSYAGDQSSAYQQGTSFAQSIPMPSPNNPNTVPGYAGTDLPQSQIPAHDLNGASSNSAKSNEAAQLLTESFEKGQRFVIDPHTDPLIIAANQVVKNPQKALDEEFVEQGDMKGDLSEEIKTCEESGEEYTQKCSKHLVIEVKVLPEVKVTILKCDGHAMWGGSREGQERFYGYSYCPNGCTPAGQRVVTSKRLEIRKEAWVDGCVHLEKLTDEGLCRYISKSTSPQNETRMYEGLPLTRDHFEEHYEYACLKASTKSCAGLREKGCYQIKSVCKEEIDGRCVLWEQTYHCPKGQASGKGYRSSNKASPFCLSGDCVDKTYIPNGDFLEVMSKMSVLKEAGDDLRSHGCIFKGQDRRCTRHCINFKDCCGNGKGWGISLSFASCDGDEKELAELRKKNRCIQVGTYCAEKVLGVCIRKKTTFCCYGTKLAKIVQEQGRRQLGLGFGEPEHPQCQGLSAEQLSQLDFSQINFSELFADITASAKSPNTQKLGQDIQQSMETRGSLLKIREKEGQKVSVGLAPSSSQNPISQISMQQVAAPAPQQPVARNQHPLTFQDRVRQAQESARQRSLQAQGEQQSKGQPQPQAQNIGYVSYAERVRRHQEAQKKIHEAMVRADQQRTQAQVQQDQPQQQVQQSQAQVPSQQIQGRSHGQF